MTSQERRSQARHQESSHAVEGDAGLVEALRRGDEKAFVDLVAAYQPALIRLALLHVADRDVAEEVVQETWLGVLQGIARFEGRSSLKTWIFSILLHRAKSRGQRERRSIAFSALSEPDEEAGQPAVDPDRFLPADHDRWPGHWATPPHRWTDLPDVAVLSGEIGAQIRAAIDHLPRNQREVIVLHDVEGFSAPEICNVLGISETNHRVLLHRARSHVRGALESYLQDNETTAA